MKVTPQDPTKGILDMSQGLRYFTLNRYAPASGLHAWIESYWVVSWDLPPGAAYRQTNIAHASINVAFEPEGSFVYGALGKTFVREIRGTGRVFGIKFRPGGFFPFFGRSVRQLTGAVLPIADVLGSNAGTWVGPMEAADRDDEQVRLSDTFWLARAAATEHCRAGTPSLATLAAERIHADRSILTVTAAAAAAGIDVRSLQRLFRREVGIGPKEVIRRIRLQEVAERLLREPSLSCGELALDMGYFDQAHFARDFRTVVGVSPEEYRRRQNPAGSAP